MYGVIVKSCEVGISSGNQALTRCAFAGTNSTEEPIASGLSVVRPFLFNGRWSFARCSHRRNGGPRLSLDGPQRL